MTRIAIIANLVAYSIIVSQPLFYMLSMTSAQRALSAPAYVELRQRINSVMSRRVPVIYSITLVTVSILLVLSFRATTLVALVCLLVDIVFMMRENVPINGVIDRWSTTDYPEDWETYRTKWFTTFAYRQVVLLVGFVSLLFGAVFQT
jgi:hypothetical protein